VALVRLTSIGSNSIASRRNVAWLAVETDSPAQVRNLLRDRPSRMRRPSSQAICTEMADAYVLPARGYLPAPSGG